MASRRFNLGDLRNRKTAVPGAPDVWNYRKYGFILCRHDYHARLIARLVPGFWKLWIETCMAGMNAAVVRTQRARSDPTVLPKTYQKTPDTYYVKFGAKWVAEHIRWGYFVEKVEDLNDEYAIPNNCTAYWARLMLKEHPEWTPFIELRESKAAEDDNGKTQKLVAAGTLPTP